MLKGETDDLGLKENESLRSLWASFCSHVGLMQEEERHRQSGGSNGRGGAKNPLDWVGAGIRSNPGNRQASKTAVAETDKERTERVERSEKIQPRASRRREPA